MKAILPERFHFGKTYYIGKRPTVIAVKCSHEQIMDGIGERRDVSIKTEISYVITPSG